MSEISNYYYNEQTKNYLIQFMAIFGNMNVSVGKNENQGERLINVPIAMGSKDRVVAAIKNENTQNKLIRLPMMSANITGISLAPELRKGVSNTRRNSYLPTGGMFPDDINVVEQRQPVPYRGTFDLTIFASNQDQHYQILEQILVLFEPQLQIQTSDDVLDWKRITTVELVGITPEENYPAGTDRRIIQTTLTFEIPMYMSIPANIHNRFVKDIYVRVGAVSNAAQNSYDIVAELDKQGLDYNMIFSLDDIDL